MLEPTKIIIFAEEKMFDLARHIEILLLDNDCVIVPDFGGFMTHHVDSCYNEEDNFFLPPSRTLGFNPQLKVNDSLLAQSYVEAYDISYPEAVKRIEDEVREIRKLLSNNGTFELNNIGVITVNEDGNMVFEPCSAGVLTPSLYALTSFHMPYVGRNATVTSAYISDGSNQVKESLSQENEALQILRSTEQKETENEEQSQKQVQNVESLNEVTAVDDEDTDETADDSSNKKVITISINALRNVAVAIVLVLVALVTTLHFGTKDNEGQQRASVDTGILQKIMPQVHTTPVREIDRQIPNSGSTTRIKEKNNPPTRVSDNQATAKKQVDPKEDVWVIVLASHVSGRNAELFIEQLKNDGIVSARMINKGHKIVCGSFESESDARSYIKLLREKTSHCDDCWITKIEE